MVQQDIVGIQKNPKEAIAHSIWTAVSPKIKSWLEVSSTTKQKITLEFIFRAGDHTTFSLVSEVCQHDEFRLGILVEPSTSRRTGLDKLSLNDRLDCAEKAIKPVILETLAVKPNPNRCLKIGVYISSGVCRWVEKILGVGTTAPDD